MLATSRHSFIRACWGQRGTMTQQTYILNHLQNLMPYPFEQQNTLFVTSPAGAETSWFTFSFSCSNTRLILPSSHTHCFPAQGKIPTGASCFGYRKSRRGGGKSVLLELLSRHSISVFHSSALRSREYLRTAELQAYQHTFFSGLEGRYEYV